VSRIIVKYVVPVLMLVGVIIVGAFLWGLWPVVTGSIRPYDSSGPFYYVWQLLYGSTRAWASHLLIVMLAAYVLSPLLRKRWLVVLVAMGVGLLAVAGLTALERIGVMHHGASSYQREVVTDITDLESLSEFPAWYFTSLFLGWLLPAGIAWGTIRWRERRKKLEVKDPHIDGDDLSGEEAP